MDESWKYKVPGFERVHNGPVEFGDGVLKLMEHVEPIDGPAYWRAKKVFGPGAWEWAERIG